MNVLVNRFWMGSAPAMWRLLPQESATSGYLYLVDDAGDGGYANGSPIGLALKRHLTKQPVHD